jgi:hypothetical protein
MAKIVLFVDALEPREIGGTRFEETQRGLMDSGAPKVTPAVTSMVQTGMTPDETGFGGQHSMNGERRERPMAPMLAEKLEQAGYRVGSFHMPYSHPQQLQSQMFVSDTMQGPQPGQNPLAQMNLQPPTPGDLMDPEDDGERAYNTRMEDINAKSSAMLNTIDAAGLDVAFIGIRSPDQYTHFQWHEDYRVELLKDIAFQVEHWETNHDVLWWSDHGSEEKTDTFRVNKWLMEKGYLDLDIDLEFAERFSEEMEQMNPQAQQGRDIENQLGIQQPGVEINPESVAVCTDPYDSCITMLGEWDDDTREELREDLESTGMYRRVVPTEDEWGNGRFREECPDLLTLRGDGVLVTGNVHPDPIGMGYYRTGVHSAFGAWGTTDDSFEREGDVTPTQFHDVVWEFITGSSQMEQAVAQEIGKMERAMQQAIGD